MIPTCYARLSSLYAWATPALQEGQSRELSSISCYPNFLRRKRRWLLRGTPAPDLLFRNNKNRPRITRILPEIRKALSVLIRVNPWLALPFVLAAMYRAVPESFDRARDVAHPAQSRRAVPARNGAR